MYAARPRSYSLAGVNVGTAAGTEKRFMKSPGNDTIAAIATGVGGGIGIIRVSGPDALAIAERIFRDRAGRPLAASAPFRLVLGTVADPVTAEPIDEVLAARMPAGKSFTGESTVEIQAHGGRLVLELLLSATLRSGARLAGPGEFTLRAFLNGRLGLTEAEAVADIVGADSEEALRGALSQLRGSVGEKISSLRSRLLDFLAAAEAALDFEEEAVVDPPAVVQIAALAADIRTLASRSTESFDGGGGVRAVIAGPPNAGKSSIFNYLLGYSRSIVTPVPGTTRDYVEHRFRVGDSSVTLIDTAGLHSTDNLAELEGVRRCLALIERADVVVLVLDGSSAPHPDEQRLLELTAERSPIAVLSKADLPPRRDGSSISSRLPGQAVFALSTVTGQGFPAFMEALALRCRAVRSDAAPSGAPPNLRHREALLRAAEFLDSAAERAASCGGPFDQAASDLRAALAALGEITGETATEEILQRIFSRFCVGK